MSCFTTLHAEMHSWNAIQLSVTIFLKSKLTPTSKYYDVKFEKFNSLHFGWWESLGPSINQALWHGQMLCKCWSVCNISLLGQWDSLVPDHFQYLIISMLLSHCVCRPTIFFCFLTTLFCNSIWSLFPKVLPIVVTNKLKINLKIVIKSENCS